MDIAHIEIFSLEIPFRFRYGHASARHTGVRAIVCIARDTDGNEGYGEAVPRNYVTGESVGSIMQQLPDMASKLLPTGQSFESFLTAIETIEDSYPNEVPNCALCALCALETAVTDLAARQQNRSVANLLGGTKKDPLVYTASIGISSPAKLAALLALYRAMGLRSFKIKVGSDTETDTRRLELIRRILGDDARLFADANCAWDRDTAARRIEHLQAFSIWAIEEPLQIKNPTSKGTRQSTLTDRHFSDNAWLQARSTLPMIADESLITLRNAQQIVESKAFRIFNIRLSKCGGYRRATQFAEIAKTAGLDFSLGAMVGESPILAAGGAAWAAAHPSHLYVQGHSHRLLHRKKLICGCAPVRLRGMHRSSASFGSGLALDRSALRRLTADQTSVDLT